MSRAIVMAAQGPFLHAWGLLEAYVDVCPDEIWVEKNGGWPVWQQLAHTIMVLDFFVLGENEQLLPVPCDMDALMLRTQDVPALGKTALRDYAATVKARVDNWIAGLEDADLARTNVVLSAKLGRETSYAATLVMLASHTDYHIGSCDAALRNHGLPGGFQLRRLALFSL